MSVNSGLSNKLQYIYHRNISQYLKIQGMINIQFKVVVTAGAERGRHVIRKGCSGGSLHCIKGVGSNPLIIYSLNDTYTFTQFCIYDQI